MTIQPPRRRCFVLALVVAGWAGTTGCAGGAGAGAAAEPTTSGEAAKTKGQSCLEDARAPREPREDAPPKITLAHILVRHAELEDPRGATRSSEQACLRALEALKALQSGQDWDAAVQKYNDAKDDSLGRVAHDELTPAFADAAFSLEPQQLSYVVESDRGFHIILRKE